MNIISPLVQFHSQLRIFHWQTDSFAKHKAYGKAYEELDGMIDTFVETYMGIYGRNKPNITFSISIKSLQSDSVSDTVIEDFLNYLKELRNFVSKNSDLQNLVDSISGEVNQLKYRLSLN
jgi:DNA-binding ferritin-like protein